MIYKGYIIERLFPSGYYSTLTENGYWTADTMRGIRKLINENVR